MKEMYPKNPDGMCSGPVYFKIADLMMNAFRSIIC